MTALATTNVMFRLRDELEKNKVLSREIVEHITGLTEKSICAAYRAETDEWLVKIDPDEVPSRMSMIKHTSYMRIQDMTLQQALAFRRYLRKWKSSTMLNADNIIEALEEQIDKFVV